jgi:Raf kinase inhibitor-like YbhB/YbcL family protein
MPKHLIILTAVFVILFCSCRDAKEPAPAEPGGEVMQMKLTSPAFEPNSMIPPKYTADGEDASPSLQWDAVPKGAKSIALVSDDPDAPMGTWVHWVIYNIPPDAKQLAENIPPDRTLTDGTCQGTNDFGRIGYGGPAPPSGTHRYFFKIHALDVRLDLPPGAKKSQLLNAMQGHILGKGELIGRYKRK